MNILQHLDPLELLVAMRINKTARDLIAEDPALLRAMGRKTSAGGRFYIPLGGREVEDYGDCGIALHAQGYLGAARGSRYDITVNIQFDCPSAWWSSLPLRLAEVKGVGRAIQLCQPSIKEVTLSLGCNHAAAGGGKDSHYHHVDRTVVSHTGITLGDLSDVASRLHLEHSQQSTIRIEGVDTICSLPDTGFLLYISPSTWRRMSRLLLRILHRRRRQGNLVQRTRTCWKWAGTRIHKVRRISIVFSHWCQLTVSCPKH